MKKSFEKKETFKSTYIDEKGEKGFTDLENTVSESPAYHLLCSNWLSLSSAQLFNNDCKSLAQRTTHTREVQQKTVAFIDQSLGPSLLQPMSIPYNTAMKESFSSSTQGIGSQLTQASSRRQERKAEFLSKCPYLQVNKKELGPEDNLIQIAGILLNKEVSFPVPSS